MTSIWGLWGTGVIWGMSHELNLRMVEAGGMQMEHIHGGQNHEGG